MLSKRLQAIADMVLENVDVVDIGCDHALLDIYLTLNNHKCTASDINKNALSCAYNNIKKYNMLDKIELVLSDGLKNIKLKNKTAIIISGMGANTIIDIIKTADFRYIESIIVQSNNDLELLRKEVCKLNYFILDEQVVLDKGIYYVVIKFKPGFKKYHYIDYKIGPILKNKRCNSYYDYLKNKNDKILNGIPRRYIVKRMKIQKSNRIIKKLLNNS